MTEPREPITFPKRTHEKTVRFAPLYKLAAEISLSDNSFVAPIVFVGLTTLSVLIDITFSTL
ncbi:hypothetical protein D3C76_1238060 [compost metagenome]